MSFSRSRISASLTITLRMGTGVRNRDCRRAASLLMVSDHTCHGSERSAGGGAANAAG